MPSILPGYEYDIFISYRQKDNKGDRWVTRFVDALRAELESTFKEDISIYFDENPHDGLLETHHVDKSLDGKLKCLIFIPIISQTYCDTKSYAWQQEFCEFNKRAREDSFGRDIKLFNGNIASRILPVKIHGLDADDQKALESEMGSVLRAVEFIYKEPGVNRPLTPDDDPAENLNKTRYRNQVNKVANAVKEIMTGLKNFGNPTFSPSKASLDEQIPTAGKSIVVLPFEDLSHEKDQDYFCDGLSEEIIASLSRIKRLRVVSRTSSMRYKGAKKPLAEITQELGVKYVLEGSVRKQGTSLKITAQLIEADLDSHLWSEKYSGTLEDIFDIQETIAGEIVKALRVQLSDEEDTGLRKRYTNSTEAHELYLRGNYYLWMVTPESVNKAIAYFEKAVEVDKKLALAYAGLAMAYNGAAWFEYFDPQEAFSKAREYASRAVEMDDTLAEAHLCLGYNNCLAWETTLAEQHLKRACELKPSLGDAHLYYAWFLGGQGKIQQALNEMNLALQLDPVSLIINNNVAFPHYWMKKYDLAIAQSLNTLKLEPTFYLTHWFLGVAYTQAGAYEKAIAAFEKAITFSGGGPFYQAWLGHANALAGNKEKAEKILEELTALSTPKKSFSYQITLLHVGLGNLKDAMHWLEVAYAERAPLMWYLKVDPYLDPLRSNPRFSEMLLGMGSPSERKSAPVTKHLEKSIIVLPFEDMSPEKDQEYFCDGLAEEIINALTRIRGMHVVARTSAFSFKGKGMNVQQIRTKLGVDSILEGSVRKAGSQLRVSVQLINVADGFQLWSQRYDRELTDIFVIQDDISLQVVNALKVNLEKGEKKDVLKRHTGNFEAHDLLVKGRYFRNKLTEAGFQKGISYFQQAIAKDERYALAYSGIADCYILLGWYYYLPSKEAFPKAKAAAQSALRFDESLSEAHTPMGVVKMIFDRDFPGAEMEFRRAIELNGRDANAHLFYSIYLGAIGRHDESILEARSALTLDPLTAFPNINLGMRYYYARRYDEAIEQMRGMLEMDPNTAVVHYYLAWPYAQKRMHDLAHRSINQAIDSLGKTIALVNCLGIVHALSGNEREAREVLHELLSLTKERAISPFYVGALYASLNQHDNALTWLERAWVERDPMFIWVTVDPTLDGVRGDPRFALLASRIGFSMGAPHVIQEKSIVVLPFENMSPDKDNEYFSDGLTEEIIADLSNVKQLSVISRSSAMTFKGTRKKAKEISAEVNVRYVLEGSVRKEGNKLRITAQLIDGITDIHIWAEKYSGTMDNVFEFQEKLSRSIVDALKIHISPDEDDKLADHPITNIQAYECYIRARQEMLKLTEKGLASAIIHLERALELAGTNATVHATFATVYLYFHHFGLRVTDEMLAKASEHSTLSLGIDAGCAQAYCVTGIVQFKRGNIQDATRTFKKVLTLDSGNTDALLWISVCYCISGKADFARPHAARLLQLDPVTVISQAIPGWIEYYAGNLKAAMPLYERWLTLDPDSPFTRWCCFAAFSYVDLNRCFEVADSIIRDMPQLVFGKFMLFYKAALKGDRKEALLHATNDLKEQAAHIDYLRIQMGMGFAMIDEKTEAVAWLRKAFDGGYTNYPLLSKDPFLKNLEGYPTFTSLMAEIKVKWEQFEV